MPPDYAALIQAELPNGLGVCAISCWEVAKLVELGRLTLAVPVEQWLAQALARVVQILCRAADYAAYPRERPFHDRPS